MASWRVYVTKFSGANGSVLWTRKLLDEVCASAVVPGWRSGLFVEGGVVYADVAANPGTQQGVVAGGYVLDGGDGHQWFALVRYKPDGSRDTTFGTGGLATTSFGANSDSIVTGLVEQADRKLVAAGYTSAGGAPSFAAARYKTDGTLDATFGTAGIATVTFDGFGDSAFGVAAQSDGKVVVAGLSLDGGSNNRVALCRLTALGALDTAFGTGGKTTTAFGGSAAFALALLPDDRIIVAGFAAGAFAVARYAADGTPDSTFGTAGLAKPAIPADTLSQANAVALRPDGRVVAAGSTTPNNGSTYQFAVAELGAAGATDWVVTTDLNGGIDQAYGLALQPDGKAVAVGNWGNAGYALARYGTGGALDSSFGSGGLVHTTIAANDLLLGVAVQRDGKVVAAGSAASQTKFGLARYTAAGALDSTFGTGGLVADDLGGAGGLAQCVVLLR